MRTDSAADVSNGTRWKRLADRHAVVLRFRMPGRGPVHWVSRPRCFPTIRSTRRSSTSTRRRAAAAVDLQRHSGEHTYYPGTTQGAIAVMQTFIPSGIHHIMIGPDHILFLVGLLLLGGTWGALVKIVTAFTIGHSLTLSLAALNIVTPPPRIIEPAIALSIVFVGADNLVRGAGRDLRAWVALIFGLVHGFGFANVLREFGLPAEALGWSLFSFNFGVEIGQLAIV